MSGLALIGVVMLVLVALSLRRNSGA